MVKYTNETSDIKEVFFKDHSVSSEDIVPRFKVQSEEEAVDLIDISKPGDYISIINQNNLSEALIYRRKNSNEDVIESCKWDGVSSDTTWYNEKDVLFNLYNVNQLKGFQELVDSGITFENKEIRLQNNMDLGYHEWTPIGSVYDFKRENSENSIYSKYDIKIDGRHVFKGCFNGNDKIIYGLSITKKDGNSNFYGFFLAVQNATIKRIIFADVLLKSKESCISFAAVAGVANDSIFSNIHVSGNIHCTKPSGICGIAQNSVFYGCKNSAKLYASTTDKAGIIVGGICQQLTISKDMANILNGSGPKIFVNCINDGEIIIDAANSKYLWAGYFFGGTFYKPDMVTFSFVMEKCKVHDDASIIVKNSNDIDGECVFFGYRDELRVQSNNIGNSCKEDLLSGIIGRVDQYVEITVIRTTSSTMVNNMVVPGSINTLKSNRGEKVFKTIDADRISDNDCIYDLEPFFHYIKTIKI
jgi:hypothetical protein